MNGATIILAVGIYLILLIETGFFWAAMSLLLIALISNWIEMIMAALIFRAKPDEKLPGKQVTLDPPIYFTGTPSDFDTSQAFGEMLDQHK